ncbi:MAG: hypothetical protein ACRC10_08395 [Thermoguttaceae bacterium]
MYDRLFSYRVFLIGSVLLLFLTGLGTGTFLFWRYGFSPFKSPLESTANYEHLDPNGGKYWALRTECDILSAREKEGQVPQHQIETQLYHNLGSTLFEARQLSDPLQKAHALGQILQTQLVNDVGTNLANTLNELDKTEIGRFVVNRYLPDLVWFYIRQENTIGASAVLRSYLQLLQSGSVDFESVEQRRIFSEMLNASEVLHLEMEQEQLFQELLRSVRSLRIDLKRDDLYAFLAGEQFRLRQMSKGFETLLLITQPRIQSGVLHKLLVNRTRFSSRSGLPGQMSNDSSLSNPELVNKLIEQILAMIARIESEKKQEELLTNLVGSDLLLHPEVRDLFQYRFAVSSLFSSPIKEEILHQLLNPQPNQSLVVSDSTNRLSTLGENDRGLRNPSGRGGNRGGTEDGIIQGNGEDNDDEDVTNDSEMGNVNQEGGQNRKEKENREPIDRQRGRNETDLEGQGDSFLSRVPPSARNRLYLQESNILMNTAQDLIRWNKRKEALNLLVRAAELCESLFYEGNQDQALTTIASMIVATGDVDAAQKRLCIFLDLLENFLGSSEGEMDLARRDSQLEQIVAIQLRARLLNDAFQTITKRLSGESRLEQFRSWSLEMLQIGEGETALAWIEQLPENASTQTLRDLGLRIFKDRDYSSLFPLNESDNLLTFSDHAEQNDSTLREDQLVELVLQQLRRDWVSDAAKTVQLLGDSEKKNSLLKQIVQGIGRLGRPYVSKQPFQQEIRNRLFDLGITTARQIGDPYDRAVAEEFLLSQLSGTLSEEKTTPIIEEIVQTTRSIPNRPIEKAALIGRLVQSRLLNRASEVRSNLSGSWAVLDETLSDDFRQENVQLLNEMVALLESADYSEDRSAVYALFASLFFQLGKSELGLNMLDRAKQDLDRMEEKSRIISVLLSLAQTMQQSGDRDGAIDLFEQVFEMIGTYINEKRLKRIGDPLLLTREKERLMGDLARAQGELELFEGAIKTTRRIRESVTEDRLFKTMGHLLLARRQYEDAQKVFLMIEDEQWKQSCVKEVLFRLQWDKALGN